MNFFGHAVLACRSSDAAPFVLGAMLPDLAGMCERRLAETAHTEIAAGIDWHHRCDRVFHELAAFRSLSSDLSARLSRRGVRRGPSVGSGHVGVELLLDGCLVDDDQGGAAYLRAIAHAERGHLGDEIAWHESDGRDRFEVLRLRLATAGLPTAYRDPRTVCERVARALSCRPLLATRPEELPALREELERSSEQVAARAPEIMRALVTALT